MLRLCVNRAPGWLLAILVSGTQSVRIGDPIRLLCNVTGSRLESRDVSWYRGSSVIRSDHGAGVLVTRRRPANESRSTLVALDISASRPRDTGSYTCRSEDRRISSSIFVHVTADGTLQFVYMNRIKIHVIANHL